MPLLWKWFLSFFLFLFFFVLLFFSSSFSSSFSFFPLFFFFIFFIFFFSACFFFFLFFFFFFLLFLPLFLPPPPPPTLLFLAELCCFPLRRTAQNTELTKWSSVRTPEFCWIWFSWLAPIRWVLKKARIVRARPCPSCPWLFGFPWLILKKEFPWLSGCFPWFFQGFKGFRGSAGRENPWVNLGVFLDKTEQPRKGRTGVWPRQGTEICNFGAPSALDFFLNFL